MTEQPFGRHVSQWLAEPLPADVKKTLARLAAADGVRRMAILPDVHLAGETCVGVALATDRMIYPAAVGSDIGCGIATVRINLPASLLDDERNAAELFRALYRCVPSNRHRAAAASDALPRELLDQPLSHGRLEAMKPRDARVQLGTLGRGNHFLEFQANGEGSLWLAVHSGSRAIGQAITRHHVQQAESRSNSFTSIDAESAAGKAYLNDVAWAIRYARANRLAMLRAVESYLADTHKVTFDWSALIHTDHDHVRRETHDGEELWVHRKGAQPVEAGTMGIVPGSMGTATYHVSGRGCAESLRSCSHGAGRAMQRGEACRKVTAKQVERELSGVWFDRRLTSSLREEVPSAYKNIERVMRAQRDLVRIERKLRPVLCYKGR